VAASAGAAEHETPTPYVYNLRAGSGHLKWGEVIVTCPRHLDLRIAWDGWFQGWYPAVVSRGDRLDFAKLGAERPK
jgi:hypothetical protein